MISDLARQVLFPGEAAPGLPGALALITSDHDEASALFDQALDESLSSAVRRSAISQVCDALTLHAKMEEAIFYPALRRAGKAEESEVFREAIAVLGKKLEPFGEEMRQFEARGGRRGASRSRKSPRRSDYIS